MNGPRTKGDRSPDKESGRFRRFLSWGDLMRTYDDWHNPSNIVRVLCVAMVYGVIGAMAGGMVGTIVGRFIAATIVGGLIGIWFGARMERK